MAGGENFGGTVQGNRTVLKGLLRLEVRRGRERQVCLGLGLLTRWRGLPATLRCYVRRQENSRAAWMPLRWIS